MSAVAYASAVPAAVARKVSRLRSLIRGYVLAEGAAAVVIVAAVAFWVGLAVDWLLEPSAGGRVVLWLLAIVAFGATAWRFIGRRLFALLPDDSLALLVERRYPQLGEGLITTVQAERMPESSADHHALVALLSQRTAKAAPRLALRGVLDWRPLARKAVAALALAISIAALAVSRHDVFAFYLSRARLSAELWPRRVALTVVGFEDRENPQPRAVARDDEYELTVLASLAEGHVAPREVSVAWRRESDGTRGGGPMTQIGAATPGAGGRVEYRYRFKVAGDMTFDVIGGDDRVRNLRLRAVDRPAVTRLVVDAIYPDYLRRAPRPVTVSGRLELPEGTTAVARVQTNKPLAGVQVSELSRRDPHGAEGSNDAVAAEGMRQSIAAELSQDSPEEFTFPLGKFVGERMIFIALDDQDGVSTREPFRLLASAIPDEPPDALVQLDGIGTAVTPQARIPFAGRLVDDNGLQRAWFEYQIDEQSIAERPFATQPSGLRELPLNEAFDLAETDPETKRPRVELAPGRRLALAVRATDAYDLSDKPRIGGSQRFTLDVVTPSQLRALLEKRELGLRQRFEAIHEKMNGVVELLARVETAPSAPRAAADGPQGNSSDEGAPLRGSQRIAGADQSATQLAFETIGVAEGFEAIVAELINNRVDTEELKERLEQGIATPLHEIGGVLLPRLHARLGPLQASYDRDPGSATGDLADCRAQAAAIEQAMREVLDRMLELESYNELVDLLRGIVDEQQRLQEDTRRQQREKLRGILDE